MNKLLISIIITNQMVVNAHRWAYATLLFYPSCRDQLEMNKWQMKQDVITYSMIHNIFVSIRWSNIIDWLLSMIYMHPCFWWIFRTTYESNADRMNVFIAIYHWWCVSVLPKNFHILDEQRALMWRCIMTNKPLSSNIYLCADENVPTDWRETNLQTNIVEDLSAFRRINSLVDVVFCCTEMSR